MNTYKANPTGRDVGLNADWSVSAWCVWHDGAGPNRGRGLYITDNENGELSLMRRDFTTEDNAPEVLATVPDDRVGELIAMAREDLA